MNNLTSYDAKRRKSMIRKLIRKGLSPSSLGYPMDTQEINENIQSKDRNDTPKTAPKRQRPYRGVGYFWRMQFYIEQNGICFYCLQCVMFQDWTLDHKTPISKGGPTHTSNLIGCCSSCKCQKKAMTFQEWEIHCRKHIKLPWAAWINNMM